MPIVAKPTSAVLVTADQVRRFLRDYPHKNVLIEDVEFSQEEINQAVEMVTSRYNAMTPQTNIRSKDWPSHLAYPMLQAVAGYLMKSAAFQQLRNQATYQDADVAPIGVDDKFPLYMQMAQQLDNDAQQTLLQVKIQNNLDGMYGSLGSGYAYVGRFRS